MNSPRGKSRGRGRASYIQPLRKPGMVHEPQTSQNDERPPVQSSEQTVKVAIESKVESNLRQPVEEKKVENLNHQHESQTMKVDPALLKGLNKPIFVPKEVQAPQVTSSLASAVNASVFVPGQAFVRHRETPKERLRDIEHFVNNKIKQLTEDPGLLDEISMSMANYLSIFVTVEDDMIKVSDLLFEKCVSQQNFQYTGSRLANYLDKYLEPKTTQQSSFRSNFLKRCSKEKNQFQQIIATNPEKACNVAMFLGELLMNYKTMEGQTINKFLAVVSDIVKQLLNCSDRKLLICTGKLLKLTGSSLDQNDPLFFTVEQLAMNPNLDKTAKILFDRVIELKRSSWGQAEAASPVASPNMNVQNQQQALPMYFPNLDGMLEEQVLDMPVIAEDEWNEYTPESDCSQEEIISNNGNLSEEFYRMMSLENYGYYVSPSNWSNAQTDDYDAEYATFLSGQQQ